MLIINQHFQGFISLLYQFDIELSTSEKHNGIFMYCTVGLNKR